MFEKYLQDIGLTDKEASVYLGLLQVDNASVIDISKKTKINRSTVYLVLESLSKKGLVSETTVGKKTHYQAETPERLETYIERQKVSLEEKAKGLSDVISGLKSIQRDSGTKPVVRYFEGKEGILTAQSEMYTSTPDGSPVYMIYSHDLVSNVFNQPERDKLRSFRLKNNIRSKVIYTSSKNEPKDKPGENTGDRIRVDEKKYPFSCDIAVYKDNIRISTIDKKLSSIYIKSNEIAETIKNFFNLTFDEINKKPPQQ